MLRPVRDAGAPVASVETHPLMLSETDGPGSGYAVYATPAPTSIGPTVGPGPLNEPSMELARRPRRAAGHGSPARTKTSPTRPMSAAPYRPSQWIESIRRLSSLASRPTGTTVSSSGHRMAG